MPTPVFLHLISHASGELLEMLARNVVAQLDDVTPDRKLWKMVRGLRQLPDILAFIAGTPGFVMHSIADEDVRAALEDGCRRLGAPCQFVLEPCVSMLAAATGAAIRYRTSPRDVLDEDYYRRIEAMKYTLAHDDGVATDDLAEADVILVGVSRATKTPTCMYLASRGVKAANVPLVPGVPPPDELAHLRRPLVVGLTIDPLRLAKVRDARLKMLNEDRSGSYADLDLVRQEVQEARRLCARHGWPIIDVSHRSIEQTASMIIEMLRKRQAAASTDG